MSTYCVLPWIHLATHPQGDASLCCRVDYKDGRGMSYDNFSEGKSFYNLNRNSIQQIINSDSFKEARLQMLNGERPLACSGCYKDEDLGLVSKRMRENEIFKLNRDELAKLTEANGEIQPRIEYAELRLGNLCNLKCRTCNPNSSSKWSADYGPMQDSLGFVRKYDLKANFKWAESDIFWKEFLASSKDLKQLYINGGEPTLIKQHWLFLERLVELGLSTNIEIKYNINSTYLPHNAFTILKNFKSVSVGVSIDDIEKRNSYIRHGSDWNEVIKNLLSISAAGFHVAIEQTVSAYNVYYLDEMEAFCTKNNLGYGLNFVYDPEYLSVKCIPENAKIKILNKLYNKLSDKWFTEVKAHLSEKSSDELWYQFNKYNEYLDKVRNESFQTAFIEFSDILNDNKMSGI
ncbi:MAG: twitch domain-containing radical SAM protein [Pseudobdellovibrio sp.]